MKYPLILLFILNVFLGSSQTVSDTIFLKKAREESRFYAGEMSYNFAYVKSDTTYEVYDWLKPKVFYSFSHNDSLYSEMYNEMCDAIRVDTSYRFNSSEIIGIPKKWSCLFRYKGEYYVYNQIGRAHV